MLVLVSVFLVLFGAPAVLLWLGRLIEARTDGRHRVQAAQALTGSEWFYRPVRPIFGKTTLPASATDNVSLPSPPEGVLAIPTQEIGPDVWYYRPMRPVLPDLTAWLAAVTPKTWIRKSPPA